ncbi:family 16 glycosylhydrolase [Kitasatospora sp. NPDC101801]|uniref:family 16 glycosylhydrolase n=1 Tax=Kitasatospora sp. NPDC101801 TaxID=3364103 RepID=UPI00380AE7BD
MASRVFRRVRRSKLTVPLLLAASGWVALGALALPAPVRLPVTLAYLLVGPGLALSRPPRAGRRTLTTVVLAVALSLAVETLLAVALFLGDWFTPARAVLLLAVLTTSAVLARPPFGRVALAALLLVTACNGGSGTGQEVWNTPGAPSNASGPADGASPAAPGPWQLVFQDEFDGARLDRSQWATCYDWNDRGCTNRGNRELEWYLPSQVSVGRGLLTLTADRRGTDGSDDRRYPWTSGMVGTGRDGWDAQPRFTFTRGYFAASIRIPAESGMFPAFWLMPANRTTPPELDVVEFLGDTSATTAQLTVHWPGPDGSDRHDAAYVGPADYPAGFHVFALAWERDSLTWYVDGVARHRETDPTRIPDQPMEVLLNLAVGYPKAPPDGVDTARLQVDWVRVWQH